MKILVSLLSAALVVQIPADPDGPLEPSVMNEVEHALGRVPECCRTNEPTAFGDIFATNGLSASAIAVSLVSRQDKDGKWINPVDDETEEYLSIEDEELLDKLFDIFKKKYEGDIKFE